VKKSGASNPLPCAKSAPAPRGGEGGDSTQAQFGPDEDRVGTDGGGVGSDGALWQCGPLHGQGADFDSECLAASAGVGGAGRSAPASNGRGGTPNEKCGAAQPASARGAATDRPAVTASAIPIHHVLHARAMRSRDAWNRT
jgi:hypothetical protein